MPSEAVLRVTIFTGTLTILSCVEAYLPARPRVVPASYNRPLHNLGLALLNALLLRAIPGFSAAAAAHYAAEHSLGLFPWLQVPEFTAGVLSFFLLDLLVYGQHVFSHQVPWLWRLHSVHHADLELDATSGIRFHPGEMLFSMAIKCGCVLLLGAPVLAAMLFEIVLNATALFSHANIHFPASVDALLRCVLVTPDMHRIHHSVRPDEMNRNFGFNVPWWDWLFRTYRHTTADPPESFPLGLAAWRDPAATTPLLALLLLPFSSLRAAVSPPEPERQGERAPSPGEQL